MPLQRHEVPAESRQPIDLQEQHLLILMRTWFNEALMAFCRRRSVV